MATVPFLTAGRLLASLVAASTCIGPFAADFNESHVYNPKWPAHARFHNGQTMTIGLLLGLTTFYFAWRPVVSAMYGTGIYATKTAARESMFCAALVGCLYYISGLSGILYPGTKWLDDEFIGTKFEGRLFGLPGQLPVFSLSIVFLWTAYALEARRLGGLKAD